jgi:hypothetical protein
MSAERGQAGVEFVALVLLACLVLGALASGVGRTLGRGGFDGRSFGGFLVTHVFCAVRGCSDEERALEDAYGARDAARVRALAPGLVFEPGERELPVDWRVCRRPGCAAAPDDRGLDAHLTAAGHRATAFTRLVRRRGRLYVEFWLYYPDSNTTLGPSEQLWSLVAGLLGSYPGFHRDDWEGVVVRTGRDGRVRVRASSHGGFQGCKWRRCARRWVRTTGWVRVSRGSHAGHVPYRRERPLRASPRAGRRVRPPVTGRMRLIALMPGAGLRERTASAEGLVLVPLETLDRRSYAPLDPDVSPPWRKEAYTDPESGES